MNRLSGKAAAITGGGNGLGAAIAQRMADEGAAIAVLDRDPNGRAVAERIAAGGGRALFVQTDVTDEAQVSAALRAAFEAFGRLDVLVNNAGITGFETGSGPQSPEHASLDDWRRVHHTNLDGTFLGCRFAIQTMRAKGNPGAIINMSSRSGVVGVPGAAAYASSKAGIRNHSKTVALYCAEQGLPIRCNSVHPAAILTPMWEPMLGSGPGREARMQAFVRANPARRFGRPEEVAAVCVLLASDEAPYVNGSELTIDGGILAGSAVSPGASDD